ncbi:MAG TPA: LysR family transcriptional regulator [Solibacterales bacterium]|nr:LysR family transcriptional regulator [Bryobacterales bacterium]
MELRQLRYFLMAAEERNVSRAAARLFVTQPAVSRQLKELEEELGAALFERERNGVRLTEAGQTLLVHAREILRRSQKAADEVRAFSPSPRKRSLAIGYIASTPASYLTAVLIGFGKRNPAIDVELRELQPAAQIEELRKGALDVALIGEACAELPRDQFEIRTVRRLPVQAVLPAGHSLAKRKAIALAELAADDFVGLAPRLFPGRNDFLRDACRQAGFEPRIRANAGSLSAVLGLIAAGRGLTLLPADAAALPHPGAIFVKLSSPKLAAESVAAWRKDNESRELKLFVEAMCSAAGL